MAVVTTAGDLTAQHIGQRVIVEGYDNMLGALHSVEHQRHKTGVTVKPFGQRGEFAFVPHDTLVTLLDADDRAPLDGQEALL